MINKLDIVKEDVGLININDLNIFLYRSYFKIIVKYFVKYLIFCIILLVLQLIYDYFNILIFF